MNREFEHKDQWALVLGGSSGLGLATAIKLASGGMNVCVVHRDLRGEMKEVEKGFRKIRDEGVEFVACNKDVCRAEHQDEVVALLKEKLANGGRIKVLVHSIARGNLKPMLSPDRKDPELTGADLSLTLQAMAISFYEWTKRLHDEGMFANEASAVAFTSEGNTKVIEGYGAVSAAKVGLESLSRQMAVEFAASGLKVNCIQAGVTDTPSLRRIPNSDKIIEMARRRNPGRRLTTPQDVAGAVYLLCREEARWINGTTLIVDGGEHLR